MKPLFHVCVAAVLAGGCAANPAQEVPVSSPEIVSKGGVALGGHDPLTYFEGSPRMGSAAHASEWRGMTFHFSSEENRKRFQQDPEAYAPQFGGHCSLAMSLGEVAPGSPQAFTLQDGRLYLHNNTLTAFLFKYLPGRMQAATQRWREIQPTVSSSSESPREKAGI